MKASIDLLYQIVSQLDPSLLSSIDPVLLEGAKQTLKLSENYQDIWVVEKLHPHYIHQILSGYPQKDVELIKAKLKVGLNPLKKSDQWLKATLSDLVFKHFDLMPYKYMSQFAASSVLFLNAVQMSFLLQLLGVFDLKTTLRTLIDQKLISDVKTSLSSLELKFLYHISKEKEKVSFKKLPLETWDKRKTSLAALIRTRGLNRLAKSIGPQDSFIMTEIKLRLDPKDNATLVTLATDVDESIHAHLIEELELTLDFMRSFLTQDKNNKP